MSNWPLTLEEAKQKRLKELADTIPETYKNVLRNISDSDYVGSIRDLAEEVRIPLKELRLILVELKEKGLVAYGHLEREDEHRVCGSGYWRSRDGVALLRLLKIGIYHYDY